VWMLGTWETFFFVRLNTLERGTLIDVEGSGRLTSSY
jgi:hypothetical protein